jgi:hypothetical protein
MENAFMNGDGEISLPDLESSCPICKGKGGCRLEDTGEWRDCGICYGAGYMPTAFGEKILALVRHNFRPMLQDATGDG